MKRIIAILLALLMVLSLAACTTKNSPVSESRIIQDITANDTYYSSLQLVVVSSNINKRQTNKESKTDYIWISIDGKNDDIVYSSKYKVTYVLYNDGWRFEELNRTDFEYTVASEPQEYLAVDEYLDLLNSEFTFAAGSNHSDTYELVSKTRTSDRTWDFVFSDTDCESYKYLSINYFTTIECSYSLFSGWTARLKERNGDHILLDSDAFLGKWHTQYALNYNDTVDVEIDIHEIDTEIIKYRVIIRRADSVLLDKERESNWDISWDDVSMFSWSEKGGAWYEFRTVDGAFKTTDGREHDLCIYSYHDEKNIKYMSSDHSGLFLDGNAGDAFERES